ncbi:hypothetical protein DSL72_001211 [Monilinia vaccinii-corymbosi]|uniref:Uncharacterized protein n=1 Tax=Monilinia vaccinii-corymbosi TaxID=61207 RepID=A0A8A3P5M3_9HELO|nr:hypothetical protein DSL72_001211 [Monilinia vaccinii-corymbosi]
MPGLGDTSEMAPNGAGIRDRKSDVGRIAYYIPSTAVGNFRRSGHIPVAHTAERS